MVALMPVVAVALGVGVTLGSVKVRVVIARWADVALGSIVAGVPREQACSSEDVRAIPQRLAVSFKNILRFTVRSITKMVYPEIQHMDSQISEMVNSRDILIVQAKWKLDQSAELATPRTMRV